MKRVLLLTLLIVSLVELDWERDRIYLVSSLSFLVLVVWSERVRCRTSERTATVQELTTAEGVAAAVRVPSARQPHGDADRCEKIEPTAVAIRGLVVMQNNSG